VTVPAGSAVPEVEALDAFVEEVVDRLDDGNARGMRGANDPRRQERVEVVNVHYVRCEATDRVSQRNTVADGNDRAQRKEQSLSDVELIDAVIRSFIDLYIDSGAAKEIYLVSNDSVDTGGSGRAMPVVYDEDTHGASIRRENPSHRWFVGPEAEADAHPHLIRR
jgi:hypothetical protein